MTEIVSPELNPDCLTEHDKEIYALLSEVRVDLNQKLQLIFEEHPEWYIQIAPKDFPDHKNQRDARLYFMRTDINDESLSLWLLYTLDTLSCYGTKEFLYSLIFRVSRMLVHNGEKESMLKFLKRMTDDLSEYDPEKDN
jgi:hypothetical protein